tara:strand:- start:19 stop:162 length:144 start_codon:yes stop_codon:yes gene_type:complete
MVFVEPNIKKEVYAIFAYSRRALRLKVIPHVDVISDALRVGGAAFEG